MWMIRLKYKKTFLKILVILKNESDIKPHQQRGLRHQVFVSVPKNASKVFIVLPSIEYRYFCPTGDPDQFEVFKSRD